MKKLKILTQRDSEKDNAISELTLRLEQLALLFHSIVARIDMSHVLLQDQLMICHHHLHQLVQQCCDYIVEITRKI